jgi:hypothetical protein
MSAPRESTRRRKPKIWYLRWSKRSKRSLIYRRCFIKMLKSSDRERRPLRRSAETYGMSSQA